MVTCTIVRHWFNVIIIITIIKNKNYVRVRVWMFVSASSLAGYCSGTVGAAVTKFGQVIGRVQPFVLLKGLKTSLAKLSISYSFIA